MTDTSPPCPLCGGPLILKVGRAGRFYGCAAYPRCRGSASAGDSGALPGEHPIEATRRMALDRLRADARARAWSEDDRADAVQEALVRAFAGGWAERPEAWSFVARNALRHLRGWQVQGGRKQAARSGATPRAGYALPAYSPETGEVVDGSPSDWLDWSSATARHPDPEGAVDAAGRVRARLASGVTWEGGRYLVRRLLRTRTKREVADAIGADVSAVHRWAAWQSEPAERFEEPLRDLAAGLPVAPVGRARARVAADVPREVRARAGAAAVAMREARVASSRVAQVLGCSAAQAREWMAGRCLPAGQYALGLLDFARTEVSRAQ